MKKIAAFITVSLLPLCFTGCGDKPVKALLYEISGNGLDKSSYIFGTHHFAPVSLLDSIAGFENAFTSADVIVGELPVMDKAAAQAEMMPHMLMPEGYSYRGMLSEEDYDLLDTRIRERMGYGLNWISEVNPAAMSVMYSVPLYREAFPEFDPMSHTSIDEYIQQKGIEEGKEVIGLETLDDQVYALFYSMPVEEHAKALMELVKNEESNKQAFVLMNDYYTNGDLQGLYDLSFNNPNEELKMPKEYEYGLNKERNDKWLKIIPGLMSEKSCFIAVGALHLPGEEGLLSQLSNMGYTVTPVK